MRELLGQAWKATRGLGQLHHESAFPTEWELRQEVHLGAALVLSINPGSEYCCSHYTGEETEVCREKMPYLSTRKPIWFPIY